MVVGTERSYNVSEIVHCGRSLVATNATQLITSPGYPAGYDNALNCSWSISAAPGYKIWFQFRHLEVEFTDECRYDHVAIYDGLYIAL